MSLHDTFGSEIPDSSPQASIIDIVTDGQHDPSDMYSLDQVETPRTHTRPHIQTQTQTQTQTQKRYIVSLSSEEDGVRPTFDEEIEESSGLFEVSQRDFINSQKQRTKPETQEGQEDQLPSLSQQQEYYDLRSGQSAMYESPERYAPVTSSSPVQPTQTEDSLPPLPQRITNSMAPSAQLTSFRMQSPTKIISTKTTPKKRNILISKDSYTLPHLLSPSKSSLFFNPASPSTPIKQDDESPRSSSSSPSIYLTARQNVQDSTSPRYEIKTSSVRFKGRVALEPSSPFSDCQTRVIPLKRHPIVEEIMDSSENEDDSEISIIEITRTVKKPKLQSPSHEVVLQVPSSQGVVASSPLKPQTPQQSPIKTLEKITTNSQTNDGKDENEDEFMAMPMDEIKKKIMQYGLKPTKSKLSMVNSLRQVTQFLSQDSILKLSQSQNINNSQTIVKRDVFAAITTAITGNSKLGEKIYTFEPTRSADLLKCLKENNVNVTPEMFKDWCDYNSICLIED